MPGRAPAQEGDRDPALRREPARRGPPAPVLEAHRAQLDGLTALFARYRAELAVEPGRAAVVLRSLVLGSRQPWTDVADRLTGEEIATVLLTGVRSSACSSPC